MNKLFTFICAVGVFSAQAQVSTFPFLDNFESFSTCAASCGVSCNLGNGWVNATGDDADWITDQGGTSSLNTGPSQDHNPGTSNGNYLYTETSGIACTNATINLISPTFDFSTLNNPAVEFYYHMFGATMGTMHFDLDTGNGNWINNVIPSWTGNQNTWQLREVNLGTLAGFKNSVKFRIRAETGTSFTSDMAIDDFKVFNDIANDLSISDIISPVADCNFGGTYPVEVEISNLGSLDQSNFSVAYQLNDDSIVTEPFQGTINSDQATTFTFSQSLTIDNTQDNRIKFWIVFPPDENNLNDTLTMGLNEVLPINTVNFLGFNGNIQNAAPGWTEGKGLLIPTSLSSNWQGSDSLQSLFLGTPTAKVNLFSNANQEWIVSPSFEVNNISRLFFSSAITTKGGTGPAAMGADDKLEVFVSTDCGTSFTSVLVINAASGLTNSLKSFSLNLNAYVGSEIIIGFRATDGPIDNPEDYDLHLSLIEARRVFPNDAGILNFRTGDGDQTILANTGEDIIVRIKNFGANPITNVPVVARVGTVNFQQIFYNTLAPNAEVDINFGPYFGAASSPEFTPIRAYTLYQNDTINSNDTLNDFIFIDGGIPTHINTSLGENNVTIYPNPAKNTLFVSMVNRVVQKVCILNLQGKIIDAVQINGNSSIEIPLNALESGIYILQLETNEGVNRSKFVKE